MCENCGCHVHFTVQHQNMKSIFYPLNWIQAQCVNIKVCTWEINLLFLWEWPEHLRRLPFMGLTLSSHWCLSCMVCIVFSWPLAALGGCILIDMFSRHWCLRLIILNVIDGPMLVALKQKYFCSWLWFRLLMWRTFDILIEGSFGISDIWR